MISPGTLLRAKKDAPVCIQKARAGDVFTVYAPGDGGLTLNHDGSRNWAYSEDSDVFGIEGSGCFEIVQLLPLQEGDVIRWKGQGDPKQEYEVLPLCKRAVGLVDTGDPSHGKGSFTQIGSDYAGLVLLRRGAQAPKPVAVEESWVAFVRKR